MFALFFVLSAAIAGVHSTFMSQQCLDCICYASTGCDRSKECHNDGAGAYFCGPFQISWAYWADGGKPGDTGTPHDFETCLNVKECAEQAVIGYMRKWRTDCNNDGVIDCMDFAAIHKTGPNHCSPNRLVNSEYWKRFQATKCYSTHSSVAGVRQPVTIEDFHPVDRTPIDANPHREISSVAHEPTFIRDVNIGNPNVIRVVSGGPVAGPGRVPVRPISWTFYPPSNTEVHRPVAINPGNVISSSAVTPKPELRPSNPSPSNSLFINGEEPVSDNCLACICEASSGCDVSKQCDGNFCGPYLISWAYWTDGGKPGQDFISCALNKKCTERAIQVYMSKWLSDCNADGVIDCDDFAAIHKLGPQSCRSFPSLVKSKYWKQYNSCTNPAIDPRQPTVNTHRTVYNPAPVDAVREERIPSRSLRPVIINVDSRGPYFPNTHVVDEPEVAVNPNYNVRDEGIVERGFDPSDFRQPDQGVTNKPPVAIVPTRAVDVPVLRPIATRPVAPQPIPSTDTRRPPSTFVEPIPQPVPVSPSDREPRINVNTNENVYISDTCMSCICEASSRCDENILCSNDIATKVCGPYQISFTYWTDAGRPGYRGSGGDYENCANEKSCAEVCVRKYVNKSAVDCNGDGIIDCLDYAAIHKAGPKACNDQQFLQSHYWGEFQKCYGFNKK